MRIRKTVGIVKADELALSGSNTCQGLLLFYQSRIISALIAVLFLFSSYALSAQTETIPAGSYIINMGIVPQTVNNALKPYGMLYDLIKNHKVGVKWIINPTKAKDGVDFTHNGVRYKGGPFIILVDYRTPAVNARITYWQSQGVVGATTVSEISVPVYKTLSNVPRWTLDKKNGGLAVPYFANAGIPPAAHGGTSESGWKDPVELDCCDDLFILPHADPIWSSHQRLYTWNDECRGGIWNGCHSGSSLENMLNPANRNEQTNFLSTKDPAFTGTSGNYANSNSLILWGGHDDGSRPYIGRLPSDPVAQYMDATDAAYTNGAEQIFIPRQSAGTTSRWNPGAKIIVYDPVHEDVPILNPDLRNAAALLVYGRAFDNPNRGYVMHNAGHKLNKSNLPANIAGQRTFFNYSWLVAQDKAENLSIVGGGIAYSGDGRSYTFNFSGGNINEYDIEWSSTCGGTFTPNANTQTLTYTPPPSTDISGCFLTVSITDVCGRTTTAPLRMAINCDYNVAHTVVNPNCAGVSNGKINYTVSGFSATGANNYNWTKQGTALTGNGTGLEIVGLNSGTYHVTVTSFTGCSATFSALVTAPSEIEITKVDRNYNCFGETGNINITATGGTAPYSYTWADGATTRNRTGLLAGTYTLTVTDTKGCTKTSVSVITGPTSSFTASNSKTDITCFGLTNGMANVTVSGGTPIYTYLWSDGNTNQNRTGLAAASYVVTVTDAGGCTATTGLIISQPPLLSVQISITNPTCPVEGNAPGNADGAINLTVSGGTPAYTYLWNNGATTQNRTNLAAGTYSVTFTDSKGCQNIKTAILTPTSSLPNTPTVIIR